jgi:O-antigen/teichoic acid export membrane protein
MSDLTRPNQAPDMPAEEVTLYAGRIPLKEGRSLREHSARGSLINAAYIIGLNTLGLVRGFVAASLLTRADYGVFGLLVVGLYLLLFLKEVGIADKYVQQDEEDQEVAFQKAFTLELIYTGAFTILLLLLVPVVAALYGEPELIAPGYVMVAGIPALIFSAPLWVFMRRMEFLKQRAIQAIEPVVTFTVTVTLAASGAGYWSLVCGVVAGLWTTAIVCIIFTPYKLRLRFEHRTLREYFSFSWPLFLSGLSVILIAQSSIFVAQWELGVAAVGAITVANNISVYAERVDTIITGTLYPAICAVADRTELLFETFVKSNRLALMWGLPFGVGLALFSADLVHFVIGDEWDPAIGLIAVYGLIAAANQLGFNWHAFYRARNDTRPIAVVACLSVVACFAATLPLTITNGLTGFGIGMCFVMLTALIGRGYYLTKLFHGFGMLRWVARGVAPTLPAVAAVLAVRLLESGDRSAGAAAAELLLYLVVTAAATLYFERALLREVIGYLRPGRATAQAA